MKKSKFDIVFESIQKNKEEILSTIPDEIYDNNITEISEDTSDNDGWSDSVSDLLEDVLTDIESVNYEIKNCVRGGFTSCKTNSELADYLQKLAERLSEAAEEINNL